MTLIRRCITDHLVREGAADSFGCFYVLLILLFRTTRKLLSPGSTAPDFTLQDETGNEIRLLDFVGQTEVLLIFYVMDQTPG